MAICLVYLTRRQRYYMAITFIILNIIQSLLGLVIILWSLYICIAIAPILYSEKSEVKFVFSVLGLYGTHVLFHNLLGIRMCQRCYYKAQKKSTRRLLFLWSLAGCNILINLLVLALMTVKISKHIIRTMRHSLEKGISHYLKDHLWKYTMDTLQVKYKCCGIKSYLDWFETVWIDEYHVDLDNDVVKKLRISPANLQLPVTPWSCCRPDFPMQCFHDPLQQIQYVNLWKDQPATVTDSIYTDGCLVLLRKPIEAALVAFIIITVVLILLQIATIIISRILYTSCRNAILLQDILGVAPGWVFGRGDCGWSKGPTLYDIMVDLSPIHETSVRPNANEKPISCNSSPQEKFKFTRCQSIPETDEDLASSNDESSKLDQNPCNMYERPRRPTTRYCSSNKMTPGSDEDPVSSNEEDALMLN